MDAGADPGAAENRELLAELRRLAERFPIPDPSWHRYVGAMREVASDLAAALVALERLPAAAEELARRLDSVEEEGPVDSGHGTLAAAAGRLRALPLPAGEHPFLDEIAVTVDAARRALAALDSVEGGEEAFAAARPPAA